METAEIQIQSLEKEYNELLAKATGLKYAIDLLKKQSSNGRIPAHSSDGYDSSMNNKQKIVFFVKREKRFLHIREMATYAHELEPETSVEDFMKKFSPALTALKIEEVLAPYRAGKSLVSTFWGSVKWFDDNEQIKKGFEYNPDYLKEKEDDYGL